MKITELIRKSYFENTLIGVILLGLVMFFGRIIFPNQIEKLETYFIPLFIIVISIEIFLIREDIKRKVETQEAIKFIESSKNWDNYLKNKLKTAQSVKVTHLSSHSASKKLENVNGKREGRIYSQSLYKFLNDGGKLTRIFCKTNNLDVYHWLYDELEDHVKNEFHLFYLDSVEITNMKNFSFMIIDDKEIIFLGDFRFNTDYNYVIITSESVVNYFLSYFEHLKNMSKKIKSGDSDTGVHVLEEFIKNSTL